MDSREEYKRAGKNIQKTLNDLKNAIKPKGKATSKKVSKPKDSTAVSAI